MLTLLTHAIVEDEYTLTVKSMYDRLVNGASRLQHRDALCLAQDLTQRHAAGLLYGFLTQYRFDGIGLFVEGRLDDDLLELVVGVGHHKVPHHVAFHPDLEIDRQTIDVRERQSVTHAAQAVDPVKTVSVCQVALAGFLDQKRSAFQRLLGVDIRHNTTQLKSAYLPLTG